MHELYGYKVLYGYKILYDYHYDNHIQQTY